MNLPQHTVYIKRLGLGVILLAWACSKIPYCGRVWDYVGILGYWVGFEFYFLSLDKPGYPIREQMREGQIEMVLSTDEVGSRITNR